MRTVYNGSIRVRHRRSKEMKHHLPKYFQTDLKMVFLSSLLLEIRLGVLFMLDKFSITAPHSQSSFYFVRRSFNNFSKQVLNS